MKGKGYSEGIEGTKMRDGSEAWLTPSGRYYIIKGVKGEFYPCKPDIFNETYEAV